MFMKNTGEGAPEALSLFVQFRGLQNDELMLRLMSVTERTILTSFLFNELSHVVLVVLF